MSVRWLATKAVFLLLVVPGYSANAFPQLRCAEASESSASLRFGQSVALSDFDADGLMDVARLDVSGLHQRVGVQLTSAGNLSFLHFNTRSENLGSLFAEDVDRDGATDLIWSELLHAEDVVVWLGNGYGHFKRAGAEVNGFTLGETSVGAPDESTRETATSSETDLPLDHALNHKSLDHTAIQQPNHNSGTAVTLSPALTEPADRGPPLAL